jgi:hypothetical protein
MVVPGVTVLPEPAWVVVLLALAVVAARLGRGRSLSHLALEPFTMAMMVVLGMLLGHGTAVGGHGLVGAHPGGHGGGAWLTLTLAVAVAVLSLSCLAGALRAAARGLTQALLPLLSSIAMCTMAACMLVAI